VLAFGGKRRSHLPLAACSVSTLVHYEVFQLDWTCKRRVDQAVAAEVLFGLD